MSIHVVGIGLDGAAGLKEAVKKIVESATLLVGSERHLSYFPEQKSSHLILGDISAAITAIKEHLNINESFHNTEINRSKLVVVLVSGDPLFFGLGRLLLAELPSNLLTFYPQLSSVQLAFNRIKLPWQDATIISAHGRGLEQLTQVLKQGLEKVAILTDDYNSPSSIARLFLSLNLPFDYQFWVCENLGGPDEQVNLWPIDALLEQEIAPLNVLILIKQNQIANSHLDLAHLPAFGLPDRVFLTYVDKPNLMTKREVRIIILGELSLQPNQIVWDIGAGTGSVSIEIARMFPSSQIYAIEKTTAGSNLIEQNSQRFQVNNIISIHGKAPEILHHLRAPNRIFIGGSSGELTKILGVCAIRLLPGGVIVLALATLEHLNLALAWLQERKQRQTSLGGNKNNNRTWNYEILQVQLSRSVPVGNLTRFSPLNPVTILKIYLT